MGGLLVASARAGDGGWRARGSIAPAAQHGDRATVVRLGCGESARVGREGHRDVLPDVRLGRNAGPGVGLSHDTVGEADARRYPQVTGERS